MSGKREDKQPIVVELHDNNQATDNPGGTFKDESESKEGMKPTGEESSIEETQNMDQDKTCEAGTSASGHTESPPHDKSCEAEIPASGHTESPPHDEGSISARTVTGRKTACLMRCLIWILRYPCTCSKQKVSINFIGALWMGFDLIKIILVSIYVCKVAEHRGRFSVLVNHGHVTLRHMLLRGWDASFETLPYPPAHGEFAVYNVEDLVKSIDYTVQQLYNAEVAATGNFMKLRKDDIIIAFTYFNVTENKSKQTFSNLKIKGSSVSPKYGLTNRTDARGQPVYDYNIHSELIAENLDSIFQTVLSVKISFSLHSLKVYDEQDRKGQATCLQINGTVTFNDKYHNGQVIVDLQTQTGKINCSEIGYVVTETDSACGTINVRGWVAVSSLVLSTIFELFAIIIWSMTCCKGFCCKTNENRNEEENPTFQSRLVRIRPNAYFRESCAKLWEVATMFGNALTIAGISIFFQKCGKSYVLADLDKAAVLDGVGLAVCYFTFIRFMKFNSNFSLLFNTIKKAAPGVLSFLLCVGMLFVGSFMFAYVVLGPYHVKFDEPQKTFDTLFSIINGDEIFATMAMLEAKKAGNSGLIATFMYIFVYTYVLLFTVVVFNLLIALFNSAYEEMQKMDEEKKMKKLKDRGLTKGLPDDGSNETQRVDLKEPYELSDLLKEWNPTCSGYIEKEPCSRLRAICYPDI